MRHVIIGAGPAGVIAAETIRRADSEASITIIGKEKETPYSRMAIPYLLHGRIEEKGANLRLSEDQFKQMNIDLRNGNVNKVVPDSNQVVLDSGETLDYDQLLIATGSRPYTSDLDELNSPRVQNCWTLEDARRIMDFANKGDEVLLVGAGFVACIIMNALIARGTNLTDIVRGKQMVRSMMNPTASAMVKRWCLKEGLNVMTETTIEEGKVKDDGRIEVTFNTGKKMDTDLIIVATGVQPNVEFLEGSGIKVENGIVIDEYLRSNIPNIYAAGDCAQGFDFSTGEQSVHIIQPTAADHGRTAALNMMGRESKFIGSILMNVLDTMGLISGSFGRWQGIEGGDSAELLDEENYRYINLQFDGDRLIGALTLGHTGHVGVVRGLIQSRVNLGEWKERLIEDPTLFMHAYLAKTQSLGHNAGVFG